MRFIQSCLSGVNCRCKTINNTIGEICIFGRWNNV